MRLIDDIHVIQIRLNNKTYSQNIGYHMEKYELIRSNSELKNLFDILGTIPV